MFCRRAWRQLVTGSNKRMAASNRLLPPAGLGALMSCGVRSCDGWEPRPTSIAVSSSLTAGDIRPTLLLLLSAVGLVLLIACANVGNLALARAAARQREMAVRAALGADPWRLLRQVLTENLLLGLFGGTAGTLVAFWGIRILNDLVPYQAVTRLQDFGLDTRVLGFALVISLVSGVLSGIVPALWFARLKDPLKDAGRSSISGLPTSRMAGDSRLRLPFARRSP
jgi:hypothetical protein